MFEANEAMFNSRAMRPQSATTGTISAANALFRRKKLSNLQSNLQRHNQNLGGVHELSERQQQVASFNGQLSKVELATHLKPATSAITRATERSAQEFMSPLQSKASRVNRKDTSTLTMKPGQSEATARNGSQQLHPARTFRNENKVNEMFTPKSRQAAMQLNHFISSLTNKDALQADHSLGIKRMRTQHGQLSEKPPKQAETTYAAATSDKIHSSRATTARSPSIKKMMERNFTRHTIGQTVSNNPSHNRLMTTAEGATVMSAQCKSAVNNEGQGQRKSATEPPQPSFKTAFCLNQSSAAKLKVFLRANNQSQKQKKEMMVCDAYQDISDDAAERRTPQKSSHETQRKSEQRSPRDRDFGMEKKRLDIKEKR